MNKQISNWLREIVGCLNRIGADGLIIPKEKQCFSRLVDDVRSLTTHADCYGTGHDSKLRTSLLWVQEHAAHIILAAGLSSKRRSAARCQARELNDDSLVFAPPPLFGPAIWSLPCTFYRVVFGVNPFPFLEVPTPTLRLSGMALSKRETSQHPSPLQHTHVM